MPLTPTEHAKSEFTHFGDYKLRLDRFQLIASRFVELSLISNIHIVHISI